QLEQQFSGRAFGHGDVCDSTGVGVDDRQPEIGHRRVHIMSHAVDLDAKPPTGWSGRTNRLNGCRAQASVDFNFKSHPRSPSRLAAWRQALAVSDVDEAIARCVRNHAEIAAATIASSSSASLASTKGWP